MKKQNWNDCARWTLAILGAFGLALFSLGAAACENVADPPTNKPPDEGGDIVVPDVKSLKGSRSGDASDIITIDWTDPAGKDFDFIELSFTPAHPSVPEQPIQVEKGTCTYELDHLTIAQAYKFTLKAVKGTAKSKGNTVTVLGATVDIDTAIALAIAAGSGAGTLDDPFKFTLKNVDLSNQTTLGKLLKAIGDSEKEFFDMDLSDNGTALLWPRITTQAVTKIVGIVLPDGVREIADDDSIDGKSRSIFSAYTNLQTVSAASVEIRGKSAFRLCYNLREAKFPKALAINNWAFDQCRSLETVDTPKVKTIGQEVFLNNVKLQGANFPAMETIGDNAFYGCVLLNEENVNFDSLTNLGKYVFKYGEITIAPDPTVHKGPVFTSTKRDDSSLVFPRVKTIGQEAFSHQFTLADAYFPEATSMGANAFSRCKDALANLEKVNFNKLETLAANAFTQHKSDVYGASRNGPVISSTKRADGTLVFPKVKTIGKEAFENQFIMADAYFPEAVSTGENAFKFCTALTDVNAMNFDKLETIGKSGLAYWSGVPANMTPAPAATTGIVISSTLRDNLDPATQDDTPKVPLFPAVQTIGETAYANQYTMADAYFPSAKTTGRNPFSNCLVQSDANAKNFDSLETISQDMYNYLKGSMIDGIQLYTPKLTTTLRDNLDPATRDATPKVPMFPKVKTIGADAFRWQYALADAYFPEAESVGDCAFSHCSELKNAAALNFDKVTSIGVYAFYRDNAATAPDGTTGRIGTTFELTRDETTFPDRVLVFPAAKTLANHAFGSQAGTAIPAVIDFPAATTIGETAFHNRTGVTKVNLPAVTSIHANMGTLSTNVATFNFSALPALPSATFFRGRTKLKVANISSLTALAADAFVNCPALDELYVGAAPPQATAAEVFGTGTAGGNTFYNGNEFTIFVPAGNNGAGTAWQNWINATLAGPGLAGNVTVTVPTVE
jgi:hypothetical protein